MNGDGQLQSLLRIVQVIIQRFVYGGKCAVLRLLIHPFGDLLGIPCVNFKILISEIQSGIQPVAALIVKFLRGGRVCFSGVGAAGSGIGAGWLIHYLLLEQPIRYHALIISPAFLKGIGLPDDVSLVPLIRDPRISELFETVITENRERLPFYRTAQNAAVSSLLVQLCRDYRNHDPSVGRDAAHNSKVRLVRQCMDYINRHYLDGISTSDISREIGITVNYLCACFKDVTNMTIKKYINSMKCRDAEAMLSSGSYTVTEAGLHCGFDNMAYFAKMYRLIIGENPSVTAEKSKTAAASPQNLSQRARDVSDTHIPVAEAGTSGIPHATQS